MLIILFAHICWPTGYHLLCLLRPQINLSTFRCICINNKYVSNTEPKVTSMAMDSNMSFGAKIFQTIKWRQCIVEDNIEAKTLKVRLL